MLSGIHWDCIPEKNFLSEVRKLNVEGKVIIPDGLKRVAEYFWGFQTYTDSRG